jgi:hypothetical protein
VFVDEVVPQRSRGETVSLGAGGVKVLCLVRRSLRASAHVQRFARWASPGPEAWKEKALERRKPRRGSAIGAGQLGSVRTDSQEEQGFEVGVAGGTDVFRRSGPEQPGSVPRRAERELIVVGGIRQLRASAGVEETGGDKA